MSRAAASARKSQPQRAQIGDDRRQQRGRDGTVDQQRLGGAADAGAAHLGVRHDAARHRVVGGRVHVGVAKPLGMRQHRHARLALHALDQRLAAARHDQVEQAGRRQHRRDIGAIGVRRDLHAGFRQSGRAQPRHQRGVDRLRAVHAFRTAAQDHRVARLQADAGGIGADIRPAFVDHADHADRRGDALDAQAVRPRPVGQRAAERIGQLRDVLQPFGHGIDARFGQREPVAERGGAAAGGEVGGIGGKDRRRTAIAMPLPSRATRRCAPRPAVRASTCEAARAALAARCRCWVASVSMCIRGLPLMSVCLCDAAQSKADEIGGLRWVSLRSTHPTVSSVSRQT